MTVLRASLKSVMTMPRMTTPMRSFATQSHTISNRILQDIHPLQLFRIVQDVDKYQEFLPFCGHSRVFPETIARDGRFFEAELEVGWGGSFFQTRYLSRVSVDPDHLIIQTHSGKSTNSSMFDSLNSRWKLRPIPVTTNNHPHNSNHHSVGTSVDFSVQMTVSDPMVAAVLSQTLKQVAETQVKAFWDRCKALPKPTKDEILRAEHYYKTLD